MCYACVILLNVIKTKQQWCLKWQENGWLTSKNKPVGDQSLRQELIKLSGHHEVEGLKVKVIRG